MNVLDYTKVATRWFVKIHVQGLHFKDEYTEEYRKCSKFDADQVVQFSQDKLQLLYLFGAKMINHILLTLGVSFVN